MQMGKLLIERGHLAMLMSEEADGRQRKKKPRWRKRAPPSPRRTRPMPRRSSRCRPPTRSMRVSSTNPTRAWPSATRSTRRCWTRCCSKASPTTSWPRRSPRARPNGRSRSRRPSISSILLYKNYREQWAGLAAQMWQAKCYEEQGEIGAAIAIYKELMEHTEPRLRDLQRNVGYFYIVALGKRKQYALAADEASRWLATYNRREERRSPEGLGVLIELAKNIDAQMPEISTAERPKAIDKIVDAASQVVRFASPYKKDALALLKKYKPSAAMRAEEIARLTYEDAIGQGRRRDRLPRVGARHRPVAGGHPQGRPQPRTSTRPTWPRHSWHSATIMNKQYYEADVLAEHLARRYPQGGLLGQGDRDRHAGPGRRL